MCVSNTLQIDQLKILHFFNVKMNHLEEHLMVSSRVIDSKVFRMAIQFEHFFLIRCQNGKCEVTNFRRFLFGTSPDVSAFKVRNFTNDFKF